MTRTSAGVTDEAREIADMLTPGEQRLLDQADEMWTRGMESEGFGFGIVPRGGQHRCAAKLIKLGMVEWACGPNIDRDDGAEVWFVLLVESKLDLVRSVLMALGRLDDAANDALAGGDL